MKLEVGMYVRTDLGNIGKIVEEYTHQNNKVSYPEPQEWVLDTGYILNEAMMYKNEEITKASHNIIDLIEVGDYLNGFKVSKIERYDTKTIIKIGNSTFNVLEGEKIYTSSYDNNNGYEKLEKLKSIVTKEQFESISYEVE